ncbi:hypothetical protein ALC56_06399 [Trachymyrmex septentrionalis]|uniref:Uncharacterized protein n=1 Tax=Trachymyrmex septentrionalis TaxID=34720 RepID=A0A151JX41_9HYME|nr:hypothetical protein ALC56_06399 [Trachymyrmex septentrionalis]
MDRVKLAQKVTRIAFTRAYAVFQAEKARQPLDITSLQVAYALVQDKASELKELSLKLRNLMIQAEESEEALCREIEHADEYAAKYHQAKFEVTGLIERQEAHESTLPAQSPSRRSYSALAMTQESMRTLKLPKIELRKFGGDIKDWLPFWGTFKKIHVNPELAKEDKFHYLVQSMETGSRACEVVSSFPPTAENYEKAIQSLESRFGKKELLIEFYVRELLKLVLNKSKKVSLATIYDKLETHMRSLETLDENDKYSKLKEALTAKFTDSQEKQMRTLLLGIELGDKKFSQLLREMRALAAENAIEGILRTLWYQRAYSHPGDAPDN